MKNYFEGYLRPDGKAGVRNYVLIIPSCRVCNIVAKRIEDYVVGVKAIMTTGEVCRHGKLPPRVRVSVLCGGRCSL